MKISIIIPTYNMGSFLAKTLQYLSKQKIEEWFDFEVIIVDDGSNDFTEEVIKEYSELLPKVIYIFRPRDELSCRSRARNLGIEKSSGDILVFLDCGMLVGPNFVQIVADRYNQNDEQKVLLHYILGKRINPIHDDVSILNKLAPESFEEISKQLIQVPSWRDRREGIFNFVNDRLDSLPAPWVFGDSACISVNKNLVFHIDGFDNSFVSWGVEDVDLAYRLHKIGAHIYGERDALAFHLPHPTMDIDKKLKSNKLNKIKFHRKYYTLETELYRLYPNNYINFVITRYNNLLLQYILPPLRESAMHLIKNDYLVDSTNSLLIGIDNLEVAKELNTTHIFTHNESTFKSFSAGLDCKVDYLLGCDTPYTDSFFDIVLVTDFIRLFPKVLLEEFLLDVTRISDKVVILFTENFTSIVKIIDEYPWTDLNYLKEVISQLGIKIINEKSFENNRLIEISKND